MQGSVSRVAQVMIDGGVASELRAARLFAAARVMRNGSVLRADDEIRTGDRIAIDGLTYDTLEGGAGRLQLLAAPWIEIEPRPVRLHAGLHKCLTMYFQKIYRQATHIQGLPMPSLRGQATGFRHYYHRADTFSRHAASTSVASLSGSLVDLKRFSDIRVVRVVRDPRDLVVSGYHYHRRGAEHWCHYPAPQTVDWAMVGGVVSEPLSATGQSLMDYLATSSTEDGLRAEIAFRSRHFAAMREWVDDPRVLVLRYEDILGHEKATTARIARHFGWSGPVRLWAERVADRFKSGGREVWRGHIRDPRAEQWRGAFSKPLATEFSRDWGDVLHRYGYAAD